MKLVDIACTPLWAGQIFTGQKSFLKNPLLGNPTLNQWGLHKARLIAAGKMAQLRRLQLKDEIMPEHRAEFDENGFIKIENAVPDKIFAALTQELYSPEFKAREMRQGQTVTRMIPLSAEHLAKMPHTRQILASKQFKGTTRYASSFGGQVVSYIQTVIAEPAKKRADPQTALHADTFHPSAKAWLFMQDVGEDDGPFAYVAGSNKLTQERINWEYEQSCKAHDEKGHHAHGSFRVSPDDLSAMNLPQAQRMVVKANTLIIGDTFGFHGRTPSPKPTTRVELHGYLRRNPFLPWAGLDPQALPLIKGRGLDMYLTYADWQAKRNNRNPVWRNVASCKVDAPAHI